MNDHLGHFSSESHTKPSQIGPTPHQINTQKKSQISQQDSKKNLQQNPINKSPHVSHKRKTRRFIYTRARHHPNKIKRKEKSYAPAKKEKKKKIWGENTRVFPPHSQIFHKHIEIGKNCV